MIELDRNFSLYFKRLDSDSECNPSETTECM